MNCRMVVVIGAMMDLPMMISKTLFFDWNEFLRKVVTTTPPKQPPGATAGLPSSALLYSVEIHWRTFVRSGKPS
jgi:hypothetical protein